MQTQVSDANSRNAQYRIHRQGPGSTGNGGTYKSPSRTLVLSFYSPTPTDNSVTPQIIPKRTPAKPPPTNVVGAVGGDFVDILLAVSLRVTRLSVWSWAVELRVSALRTIGVCMLHR